MVVGLERRRTEVAETKDTFLAFLLGAVTGGIVALMLAPASGSETRRKLAEASSDAYRRCKDSVDQIGGDIGGQARGVADSARHQVDAVKGAVSEAKGAYQRELKKG